MGACGSRTGGDGGATSNRPYNSTEKGPRGILGKGFHDVTIDYNLGVELGKGTFGVVRKATCAKTDESFACKSIAKRRLRTKAEREMIKREVEIQHHLGGHSGIVNIVEAVEDRKHVHLILEAKEPSAPLRFPSHEYRQPARTTLTSPSPTEPYLRSFSRKSPGPEIARHRDSQNTGRPREGEQNPYRARLTLGQECSGGELFDRILSKGIYSEADAAATIRDIVEVVRL